MDLKILAEDIGLPKEATTEQMVERIRGQGAEIKRVVALNEQLVKALSEAQAEALKGRKAQEELKASEGRRVVEKAVVAQILDAKDADDWVGQYQKDPDFVTRFIDNHKYRTVLATQQSLHGVVAADTDVDIEIAGAVAELMAKDESFRGKPGAAGTEVMKRDQALSERYRQKHVRGLSGGGEG